MLSIKESKKILGSTGEKLKDKEIEELRNNLYFMIGSVLDDYENREK